MASLAALLIGSVNSAGPGNQGPERGEGAAAANRPTPAASPPLAALVDDGRRRYTGLCVRCHGLNLVTSGIGFDLRTFPRDGKERFTRSVRKGLRAMPSFESIITETDIDALWAYIGSVNGWNP